MTRTVVTIVIASVTINKKKQKQLRLKPRLYPKILQPPGGETSPEPGMPTEEQIAAMNRLKAMMAARGGGGGGGELGPPERTGPPPTPGHRI